MHFSKRLKRTLGGRVEFVFKTHNMRNTIRNWKKHRPANEMRFQEIMQSYWLQQM